MSEQHFTKIVSDAKPLAEEVCLHLMGEPLAHPEFASMLAICGEVGVKVQLTSNGLLIAKHQDTLLASQALRQINFSLQSFKDNFPHRPLEGYLAPLLEFAKLASIKRPELYINLRLWNVGADNADNEEIFRFIEQYFNIQIKRAVDVGGKKSKKIWNKLYLHFDSRFEWPSLALPFQSDHGKCHALTGHIGIHADGTVVPCCLDKEAKVNLGNCLERSLPEIMNGERAVKMKEGFAKGILVEELCKHCSYINRFKKTAGVHAQKA